MADSNDLKHMRRAIELSELAGKQGDKPFGAVIVDKDGEVVAEGQNLVNTSVDISLASHTHRSRRAMGVACETTLTSLLTAR